MGLLGGIEFLTTAVEAGSFAAAAKRLGVTPSAVSRRVAQLERELGVTLLARTTRSLRLTNDGQAFYERCARVLVELGEARDVLARASQRPAGRLRVDVPVALGRERIAPALPHFLARYPDIRVDLTVRDQHVDPVAEGIDVLVRIGRLGEQNLMSRKLGESRIHFYAAPAYLRKHGTPAAPADVAVHSCLGYLRDGHPAPFSFVDKEAHVRAEIAGRFHTNDAHVLREAARAGVGIVALFDFLAEELVARGELVPVLEEFPSSTWPIHALYPRSRHLVPKVSVLVDFLAELFAPSRRRRR